MTIQTGNLSNQHLLHFFDGDLGALHSLLLEMTDLLMYQLEQTLHALDYADMDLALRVISRDRKIDDLQVRIESQVRTVIERYCSLASDLRTVLMISKIANSLEKIGNEIVAAARQVKQFYERNSSTSDAKLLADIFKTGNLVKIMLDKMMAVLETRDANQAYKLTRYAQDCESQLQQGIKQQLILTIRNADIVEISMDVMHILTAFERSTNHCQKIAEYQILMLDSIDMRRYPKQIPATTYPD